MSALVTFALHTDTPPPFTKEVKDVSAVTRRAVHVHELCGISQDFRRRLGIAS
jgi:hypothetical protein